MKNSWPLQRILDLWEQIELPEQSRFLRTVERRKRTGRSAYCDGCEQFDEALRVVDGRFQCSFCGHRIDLPVASVELKYARWQQVKDADSLPNKSPIAQRNGHTAANNGG